MIAVVALAAPAVADLYRWVDERGVVHIAGDLAEVPARFREQARHSAGPSRAVNRLDQRSRGASEPAGEPEAGTESQPPAPAAADPIEAPASANAATAPAPAVPKASARRRTRAKKKGRVHVLRTDRAGHQIKLPATLNGSVTAAFIVDTGASINTIPIAAVRRLGIEIDEDTPVLTMVGVGGKPMRAPMIMVDSVQLGTARVDNVEMAVVETMSTGLLGMPYFNNFKVQLDPTAGTLTLEEIDINAIEGVYGGYDRETWRMKFGQVQRQLDQVEAALEDLPSGRDHLREGLEERREHWESQLELLDDRARRAGVPASWR